MGVDTLKGNMITDLDAGTTSITVNGVSYVVNNGIVFPNPNDYGPALPVVTNDFVTPTALGLAQVTSTYKMTRLPSTASICEATLFAAAQLDSGGASAALTVDVGAYYSDSVTDSGPTDQLNIGLVISANCFLANHSFATTLDTVASGLAKPGDLQVNAIQSMNANLIGSPLWKQAGLTSDPGGFIDIVVAVHTAANTGVATPFGLSTWYRK